MADLPEPTSTGSSVYDPSPMPPTPEEQSGLHQQWTQFLANPDNRAALFQAGVALLQPIGVGQTVGGHIAQAIGMAGETIGDRQTQRNQMANESLARQLAVGNFDLAGRRVDLEGQQEARLSHSAEIAASQGERGLDIAQENADSTRTRSNRQPGLTPNRMDVVRSEAMKAYNDITGAWKESGMFSSPDLTFPQFLKEYLQQRGIDPALLGAAVNTAADEPKAGDLTAAPAGTGPSITSSTPPVSVPDAAKPSANQYLLRYAPQWAVIQGALQSSDPETQKKGQAMYQRVLGGVKDPENLPATRPPILGPISPTSVPTQTVPTVPPPPPMTPVPAGNPMDDPTQYLKF